MFFLLTQPTSHIRKKKNLRAKKYQNYKRGESESGDGMKKKNINLQRRVEHLPKLFIKKKRKKKQMRRLFTCGRDDGRGECHAKIKHRRKTLN